MVRTNCIEKPLSALFYRYGKFIARHPVWFLIIPVLIAGGLGSGIIFLEFKEDIEYLYTPQNGEAKEERKVVQNLFPVNDTGEFQANRLTTLGLFARLIILSKDGGSILRENVLEDIISLDEIITNITRTGENQNEIKYSDVCAKWNSDCSDLNIILALIGRNATNMADLTLTYPEYDMLISGLPPIPPSPIPGIPLQRNKTLFLGNHLSGVITNDVNEVLSASAVQMSYYLDSRNETVAKQWLDEFLAKVSNLTFLNLDITYYTSETLEIELDKSTGGIVSFFSVTFTIMITFSIFSCAMVDWVLTKPWLGCLGVLSAVFAVASSIGLVLYTGVEFINIVAIIPFLILAIGVDDMFVMLAAWRQTDPRLSVEDRMGQTFSEAAVSITITSITDALAFSIGAITYYPSVRIFCTYAGVAVLFDFAYQITFFGACMVFIGKREEQNRHAGSCMRVFSKDESEHKSTAYKVLCAGGYWFRSPFEEETKGQPEDKIENKHAVMTFFKKSYGPFLTKLPVKIVVLIMFVGYLGVAVWGCTQIREGLQLRHLAPDDSYVQDFYINQDNYFTVFGPPIAVVFQEQMDYSNDSILTEINGLLSDLGNTGYFYGQDNKISWLHSYKKYLNDHDIIVDKNNFTTVLADLFLNEPVFDAFQMDLKFDISKENILSSRILVQSKDLRDSSRERDMMLTARNLASSSKLNFIMFHPVFIFWDQYVTILSNTLQNVGIATACMLVVSLFLIPNPVVSIWVFLSIASICTGVIGLMTLWNVDLDSVAMINIIMCIGFCVDFSAHIAYAFTVADDADPNARMCTALGSLGLPIVQGAFSTVAGIVILAAASTYVFRTFFKIMFLVIGLGTLHGLVLLPVLMALTGQSRQAALEDSHNKAQARPKSVGPSPSDKTSSEYQRECTSNNISNINL